MTLEDSMTFDLFTDTAHFNMWYNSAAAGAHTLAIQAVDSTNVYSPSIPKLLGIYNIYSITPSLSNVTAVASNPSKIGNGMTTTLTYTANSGYSLPAVVTVTGATGVWVQATGVLTLSNPTGNISFDINGEPV